MPGIIVHVQNMNYVPDMLRLIMRKQTIVSFISTWKRGSGTVVSVSFSKVETLRCIRAVTSPDLYSGGPWLRPGPGGQIL